MTVLLGGSMGLLYDGLRLFRRMVAHHKGWIQAEDGLYWLFLAPAVFWFLLKENSGEIRFFIFLGLGGGLLLYFCAVSPFVLRVGEGVLRMAAKILGGLLLIICTPFRLIYHVVKIPLEKFGAFYGKQRKKGLQLCKVYVKIKLSNIGRDFRILRKKR